MNSKGKTARLLIQLTVICFNIVLNSCTVSDMRSRVIGAVLRSFGANEIL
jgi:hypothetical protein